VRPAPWLGITTANWCIFSDAPRLEAYFDTGGVATESAQRLHVSVRTVTYRLDRIKKLSGYNPADPGHRFTLQAAVLGAKALNWPEQQLPTLS
jgi:hypothetical protein